MDTEQKGWKKQHPRQLKKIVYGMSKSSLEKVIESHESRGWIRASEIKEHGYGLGVLMVFDNGL